MKDFYPTKDYAECELCGISSFAHRHYDDTLPKDFVRIDDHAVLPPTFMSELCSATMKDVAHVLGSRGHLDSLAFREALMVFGRKVSDALMLDNDGIGSLEEARENFNHLRKSIGL